MLSWWSCRSLVAQSCGLLNHLNRLYGEMFKLNAKLDVDLLLYSFWHFEWDSHTVYMFTQWNILIPLTSTVIIVCTCAFQSTLLASRLHKWCANCSCYIYNGWNLSRQTSYMWIILISTKIVSESIVILLN